MTGIKTTIPFQEAINEAVGLGSVGTHLGALAVSGAGGQVEAFILFVAAGQRAAGEVPAQAEDAGALLGRGIAGASKVLVDQGA